jgi:general secretion pathway protein N
MSWPKLSRKAWLAIGALLLISLIGFMPMRCAVGAVSDPASNFSASGADGTIWSGRVHEVRIGKLSIGTVNAGIDPLALFAGRTAFWFEQPAAPGTSRFRGRVSRGFGSFAASELQGAVPVADIVTGLASAQVEFDNAAARFSGGKCQSAIGNIRLKPQGSLFAALGVEAGLLGKARCDAGDLLLPLSSASGMERLELRISADGRYRASLQLQQPGSEAAPLLSLAGFAPIAGGFRKTGSGRLW